ncbi:hypothetical protein HHK36_011571 [Tetracentron sinense]|uniref:Uncharacterized protein n=1 Tax=Tetracentron sinense TaxID=13715 RepID=A0A834ZBC3_TETSI|nr:hypothetical protein HHK36_011571 [Tetracentron sinense]
MASSLSQVIKVKASIITVEVGQVQKDIVDLVNKHALVSNRSIDYMEEKALIRMLILFLGFSYVLSSAAVPLSRIFKSINANPSAQELMAQVLSLSLFLSHINDNEAPY